MLTSILERAYKISIDNYLIETISEYYSEVVTHSFASNEASHRGFKQFLLPLKLSQFFVNISKVIQGQKCPFITVITLCNSCSHEFVLSRIGLKAGW